MINTKSATMILWFTLVCVMIFGSFILKNQVYALEEELAKINKSIQNDIRNIHVLKAEWGHLNNPERLKKLADKHISLNKMRSEQIINYSALPFQYENNNTETGVPARANSKEYKRLVKAVR